MRRWENRTENKLRCRVEGAHAHEETQPNWGTGWMISHWFEEQCTCEVRTRAVVNVAGEREGGFFQCSKTVIIKVLHKDKRKKRYLVNWAQALVYYVLNFFLKKKLMGLDTYEGFNNVYSFSKITIYLHFSPLQDYTNDSSFIKRLFLIRCHLFSLG